MIYIGENTIYANGTVRCKNNQKSVLVLENMNSDHIYDFLLFPLV